MTVEVDVSSYPRDNKLQFRKEGSRERKEIARQVQTTTLVEPSISGKYDQH